MADEGTSSTLVLVAAILQLLILIGLFAITGLMVLDLVILPYLDPALFYPLTLAELTTMAVLGTAFFGVACMIALVFTIAWFSWRRSPSQHKTGLIVTGVFGMIIFAIGVLPGLFALIGGAIAPSESEVRAPSMPGKSKSEPTWPGEGAKFCASCGNPVAPNAEFCGVCGASLK
ncbi:MAG: zinc ribbon domain-containing protein [Candidatus Thorarchaeota archaeon]